MNIDKNNICGISDELKCKYAYELFLKKGNDVLIVCNSLYDATKFYNNLKNYTEDVWFFPMDDFLTAEIVAVSPELQISRLEVLNNIKNGKKIIITNLNGYVKLLPNKEEYYSSSISLKIGMDFDIPSLISKFVDLGYTKENIINKTGEIAVRGYVFDIFPIGAINPYRIEFWGNSIESIRTFNIDTQLKLAEIGEIHITPNNDFGEECYIRDYLENCEVIFNEYEDVKYGYDVLIDEIKEYCLESNKSLDIRYVHDFVVKETDYNFSRLDSDFSSNKDCINSFKLEDKFDNKDNSIKLLNKYMKKYECVIICVSSRYVVNKIIENYDCLDFVFTNEDNLIMKKINIIVKNINEGYIFNNVVYISENDFFNRNKNTGVYKSNFKYGSKIRDVSKLETGDFVVHSMYGVGKYLGIRTILKNNIKKDYLQLQYFGEDKLYIPVENIEYISKYNGSDGHAPKLNKLGSTEWQKIKQRAQKRAHDMADELLKLYAIRELKKGFSFPVDDHLQYDFEKEFPYNETADQLKTISEIKKDMESDHPMDRLLCGDVGYGKTEIAFRAAFKAILGGKQVALLCPTTILSSQHFQNAVERFKNFPVSICLINRFVSSKKMNENIEKIKAGTVDLIIGTHKLLNEKITFNDLGLLVIDEEQRFGVKQKEKIKNIKENVDVLTLSATPIPRTLNMSLSGLRDLSVIETPPSNRYPVQTYVLGENKKLIREAITKELSRNGQVFILFNSVEHIVSKCKEISELIPEISIRYAHGKMDKKELEDIMFQFINNEFNVLICTTIIETGIDIPNANTLIILNADRLGLSQLYQLRGRVGRTDRLAYCYLMYNQSNILKELAVKRLNTIKEFTELGSGLSIAMRDLAIRGSGDLLGSEQAGFIDAVGIELFTSMLKTEIERLKGNFIKEEKEKTIPLIDVETSVEDTYVNNQNLKIEIHKLINTIDSLDKLSAVKIQLEDRFGKISDNLNIYMYEELFQAIANRIGIVKVNQSNSFIDVFLEKKLLEKLDGKNLFLDLMHINKSFKFKTQFDNIIISLPLNKLEKHFIFYLVDFVMLLDRYLVS